MKQIIDVAVPAIVFLVMTAVGLDLSPEDFRRVRQRPAVVAAGLLGPLILLPPIALGLISWLRPPEKIAAGILLIAACPVGGISNTYSYLARASTALSVTLTGLSCLATPLTLPLLTAFYAKALGRPLPFRTPVAALVGQLVIMLLAPILLGMLVRARAPAFAARREPALRAIAFLGLALLIAFVLWKEWDRFRDHLAATALAAALFVCVSFVAGALVGAAIPRVDRRDRFTLAVEFATRNVAIATAVAAVLLGDVEFAVFGSSYFLIEAPLVGIAVLAFRRRSMRAEPTADRS